SNFHLKAVCFKRLLYLIALSGACQEVFSFFFQVLLAFCKSLASQGFWAFAVAVSLSNFYYDTGYAMSCQHLF
ncbi:hypothetical protein, partial [Mitsuokella multacida]|uniref:hypothetical protein n=1 Tax=Mitsuokella multacida TaxID=52226 RepID=UPI00265AA3B7